MVCSPAAAERADPRLWRKIFREVGEMLLHQQFRIKSLERSNQIYISRTQRLHSQIEQIRKLQAKHRLIQTAVLDDTVALKEGQATCYKNHLELAERDMMDFCKCIEALSAEIGELREKLEQEENKESDKATENEEQLKLKALEREHKKLKHAYKKLSAKKKVETSALLAEKDFVWNQFKKMESDYSSIVNSNRMEVGQANESIAKLQSLLIQKDEKMAELENERRHELDRWRCKEQLGEAEEKIGELQINVEELESSAKEKDELITRLRSDLAKLQADLNVSSARPPPHPSNSRTRKSGKSASVTTLRTSVRRTSGRCRTVGESSNQNPKRLCVDEDQSISRAPHAISRLQRCSTAQDSKSVPELGSSKLFSSNFKVPKLKDFSPAAV